MTQEELAWIASLESRHLADLRFADVSRALRALSSAYVERRGRLRERTVLDGAGKRAAFALFYGPLHYFLTRHIVEALPSATSTAGPIIDLGCGTGAAGAAWASRCLKRPSVLGVDRHPWAADEARLTYRVFGLAARTRIGDIVTTRWPKPAAFVAAFTLNELDDTRREALFETLIVRARQGDPVLVIEPLAGFVTPWWATWRQRFEVIGGRTDEWRFAAELPSLVQRLDRAAGLDHRELTGKSLWIRGKL